MDPVVLACHARKWGEALYPVGGPVRGAAKAPGVGAAAVYARLLV